LASHAYSRWFSKGAFSLLNRINVLFFGFLSIFFMVRMMPKSEIGIWVLFTSVTAILETIRHGFIRNPFITHVVSADERDKKTVISTSLALHVVLAIIISLLLLTGAGPLSNFWDAPGLDSLFYLYALNTIIFIPFLHFEYLQTAHSNFKAIFICNLCRLGLPCLYLLVLFFTTRDVSLFDLAIVQIIATIIASILSYTFVKNDARVFEGVNRKLFKELFHFGKYTFGTNISSMFVKNTDSWMIARIISTTGVAAYNPALRISNLVEVPTLAIASIVFPQVPQKMKERGIEGVRDLYYKSVSLILATMIPMVVVLYVFAEEIIMLIFGPEYVDSAVIMRVTIFYTMIIPFNRQFGTLMDGLKRPKLNFYLLIMVAVLNVIFNWIFLNSFGLIGSAYGTLLSYCIVFVLNQIILYRLFKINTLKVLEAIPEWYKIGWNIFRKRIVKVA
jgi:lipopolysaccharide exporter